MKVLIILGKIYVGVLVWYEKSFYLLPGDLGSYRLSSSLQSALFASLIAFYVFGTART
jgi:hypothetical protein